MRAKDSPVRLFGNERQSSRIHGQRLTNHGLFSFPAQQALLNPLPFSRPGNRAMESKRSGVFMIYDCFTFFDELELLELRLHELGNVVDKFVLVEATKTHSNKSKPLHYQKNRGLFQAFHDQI